MDNPEAFTFTQVSLKALRRIHEQIRFSSVRDPITLEILQRHGLGNVLMTGDPAWYSLPDLDRDYRPPSAIRRIVISEPATPRLYPQAIRLLREVRRLFPRSERFLVFHRGLRADEHTPRVKSAAARTLSLVARIQGYTPVDASYGTEQIAFYQDCDLHVGYRVHAHLNFLSIRKPSFLIMEDGRGVGQTRALGLPGVTAFEPHPVASLMKLLKRNIADDFKAAGAAVARMRETYPVMKRFLSSLP